MLKKGFTLIELIVTLCIVVLLTLMCINPYHYIFKKSEREVIFAELNTALEMAKVQALGLNQSIYITPLDSPVDWSKGLKLTYFDNKKIQHPLYFLQWHHPQWRIEWKGANSNQEIVFNYPISNSITNGQFHITNINTQEKEIIVLNRLGRARLTM